MYEAMPHTCSKLISKRTIRGACVDSNAAHDVLWFILQNAHIRIDPWFATSLCDNNVCARATDAFCMGICSWVADRLYKAPCRWLWINVARPLSPWDVHEETMRHVIAWVRFHGLSETSDRTTSPRRVCRQRFPTLRSQLMHAPARGRRRRAAAVQLEDDPAEHADSEVPPEEARSADSE